jgi:DNA-binding LacI/PurR family transcriptional regulator
LFITHGSFTCRITWNDIAAAQLTQALQHLDVGVPDEIRIAGFDNESLITRLFRPLFPTLRPDFTRLLELAVDALIGALKTPYVTPRTYYYSVPIHWRDPRATPHRDVFGVDAQGMAPHTVGVVTAS